MPRLDHVNIHTRDAARMLAFLGAVLGVREGPRPPFSNPGHWLYFDGEDHASIHLDVIETEGDLPPGILNHVAFAFFEMPNTVIALESCGYPFRRSEMPGANISQFYVTGPEGVLVEMQCQRGD